MAVTACERRTIHPLNCTTPTIRQPSCGCSVTASRGGTIHTAASNFLISGTPCDRSVTPSLAPISPGAQPVFWPRPFEPHLLQPESVVEVELVSAGLGILSGQADFFAAFTFAHRARCAAAILLRALADIIRFLGIVTTFAFPLLALTFAHRALCAADILALPAADILPRRAVPFPYAAPKAESAAAIAFISLLNRSRSFLNLCTTPPKFVIESPSRGL